MKNNNIILFAAKQNISQVRKEQVRFKLSEYLKNVEKNISK